MDRRYQVFVSGCDYCIVVIGGRYGSVGATGKSFTEMEYDFAVEEHIPVLAFLHGDPGQIPSSKSPTSGKLRSPPSERKSRRRDI
jgi:hypothetical protein